MMCSWLLGRLCASRRHDHLGPQETALLTLGDECEMGDDLQKRKAVPPQKNANETRDGCFLVSSSASEVERVGRLLCNAL